MMRKPVRQAQGIALIEAIVATVLLAIGLLGAIGMQARSTTALVDTGMRAEATIAANRLLGVMALDQANLGAYALAAGAAPSATLAPWVAETRSHIPNAAITVAVDNATEPSRTRVEITITWTRKAGTAANTHRIASYLSAA